MSGKAAKGGAKKAAKGVAENPKSPAAKKAKSGGKNPADGRAAALAALAFLRGGATCQEALARALAGAKLPQIEKNLAGELFYGSCRADLRLEFILKKFLPRPDALPAPLRDILKIALYAILHQQKTPDYAIVDSTVRAARKKYGPRLAGLANAFLRNVLRHAAEVRSPEWHDGGSFAGLAVFYAIPAGIAALWKNAYGEEAAVRLMRRSAARPWSGLLAAKSAPPDVIQALEAQCSRKLDAGYCFAPGSLPENAVAMRDAGHVFFQAPASWHILSRLGFTRPEAPVWDACAGYGGKSAALLFQDAPVALASDVSQRRLENLPRLCALYDLPCPAVVLADAASGAIRWSGDILLDVPCSGLGVLARRPDIAMRTTPEKIAQLAKIQARILAAAGAALAPGRRLAYITCTLNPAENENAVRAFLAANIGFELEAEWATPHDHPWLEGMYGATLRKK